MILYHTRYYTILMIWVWVNTYRYSLLGDEHPFTSYFDVNYRGTRF